jgi:hypothetical protein
MAVALAVNREYNPPIMHESNSNPETHPLTPHLQRKTPKTLTAISASRRSVRRPGSSPLPGPFCTE